MPDDRTTGLTSTGYVNFKSNDHSGSVAETPNRKSSREEYIRQEKKEEPEEKINDSPYVDRSAQLSATLNSLAMINLVKLTKKKKKQEEDSSKKHSAKQHEDTDDPEDELEV